MSLHLVSLCILIGIIAGLRSTAAPALVAWAAHWGWLDLRNSSLAFLGSNLAAYILAASLLVELVIDKLPSTPSRTAPFGLGARGVAGGLSAAALCASAGQSLVPGIFLGAASAVAGAFGGYHLRRSLVQKSHMPDFMVAVAEDVIAVGGGLFLLSRG